MNAVVEINKALAQLVGNTKIAGEYWPDNAVYAVMYQTKCWPCDWDDYDARFFDTKEGLVKWIKSYDEWSELEDNHYRAVYFEWDWGPNIIERKQLFN